jgi:hypothetical protein
MGPRCSDVRSMHTHRCRWNILTLPENLRSIRRGNRLPGFLPA